MSAITVQTGKPRKPRRSSFYGEGMPMKNMMPLAFALALGACAHDCNCAPVEAPIVEVTEAVEEDIVVEVEEPIVEIAAEIVEPAPVTTIEASVLTPESTTTRRVVTRRLVEEIDAGTPTEPAMEGSAATDPLLSETPRVLEDETFTTTSTGTLVEDVIEDAQDAIDAE